MSEDMTLRRWFDDWAKTDEYPSHISFRTDSYGDHWPDGFEFLKPYGKQTLTFDDPIVQRALDVPFDSGFGGEEAPRFTAWTTDHVLFKWEYGGSEFLSAEHRNPVSVKDASMYEDSAFETIRQIMAVSGFWLRLTAGELNDSHIGKLVLWHTAESFQHGQCLLTKVYSNSTSGMTKIEGHSPFHTQEQTMQVCQGSTPVLVWDGELPQ